MINFGLLTCIAVINYKSLNGSYEIHEVCYFWISCHLEEEKERVTKMDGFDILPDTLHQHDTIHSKEDIQDYYILKKTES